MDRMDHEWAMGAHPPPSIHPSYPFPLWIACLLRVWVLWLGRHSSTGTTGCEALRIAPGLVEDRHQGHQRTQGPPFDLGTGLDSWSTSGLFVVVDGVDGADNGSLLK